jgi:hypothetical protein
MKLLRSLVSMQLPQWIVVELDWRVLLFTLGVSLLVGVLSGMAPALHAIFLASLLTANLALRAEFGSDFARRRLGAMTRLFAGMFAAIIILSSLPRTLTPSWLSILSVAVVMWCGYCLLRWPLRSHWAGELMLDVSRQRQPWLMFLCAAMIAGTVMSIADKFADRATAAPMDVLRWLPAAAFAGTSPYRLAWACRVSLRRSRLERATDPLAELMPGALDGRLRSAASLGQRVSGGFGPRRNS